MGPRVKKPRSGKAKDLPTSTETEREDIEGGDEKMTEDVESNEETPKIADDHGGEDGPPLRKGRGRQNVRKGPGKVKGLPANVAVEENEGEVDEKTSARIREQGNKVASDHEDEEVAPAKKGRGRTKKVVAAHKDDMGGKDVSNGDGEVKEESDDTGPRGKKARGRKKKGDEDELEVMPKKKDRGAKKIEKISEEEEQAPEGSAEGTEVEETKQKATKRDKKQPMRKAGKGKNEEEKTLEEGQEVDDKKGENGLGEEDAEDGGGDAKPVKKAGRGKVAAKGVDDGAKKKPAGRGKKAVKGEEPAESNDVEIDGKKLRVVVEHCRRARELVSFLQEKYPNLEVSCNANPPRRNSFEFVLSKSDGTEVLLWSGINKGPPRKEKFPEGDLLLEAFKNAL